MDIEDYVHKYKKIEAKKGRKYTKSMLAEKIGVSNGHLCGVISGRYKTSKLLAYRVELVTNGEVTAEEVLSYYKDRRAD